MQIVDGDTPKMQAAIRRHNEEMKRRADERNRAMRSPATAHTWLMRNDPAYRNKILERQFPTR